MPPFDLKEKAFGASYPWKRLGDSGALPPTAVGDPMRLFDAKIGLPYSVFYNASLPTFADELPDDFVTRNVCQSLLQNSEFHTGLGKAFELGLLHVHGDLFPASYVEGPNCLSLPRSLLAIAAIDLCSPRAVRFLLEQGANPNSVMYPTKLDTADFPYMCGAGGLAEYDVREGWRGGCGAKLQIIRLFAEYGDDDVLDAVQVYEADLKWQQSHANPGKYLRRANFLARGTSSIWFQALKARDALARERWRRAAGLVGIVSFWRRLAAMPGSVGANAAIERAAKSARLL